MKLVYILTNAMSSRPEEYTLKRCSSSPSDPVICKRSCSEVNTQHLTSDFHAAYSEQDGSSCNNESIHSEEMLEASLSSPNDKFKKEHDNTSVIPQSESFKNDSFSDVITSTNITAHTPPSALNKLTRRFSLISNSINAVNEGESLKLESDKPSEERELMKQLLAKRTQLLSTIKQNEDILEKLKLVKIYKTKEELKNIDTLTLKWKSACQEAIQDLWSLTNEPRPTVLAMLNHLSISPELIGYDVENECFLPD